MYLLLIPNHVGLLFVGVSIHSTFETCSPRYRPDEAREARNMALVLCWLRSDPTNVRILPLGIEQGTTTWKTRAAGVFNISPTVFSIVQTTCPPNRIQ